MINAEDFQLIKGVSRQFFNWMHPAARRSIGEDDLFQEAYLAYKKAHDTYNPAKGTAFQTWAVTCMRNRMKDYFRMHRTSYGYKGHKQPSVLPTVHGLNEDTLIQEDDTHTILCQREAASRFLDSLTSTSREIFTQLYWQGKNHQEIASSTGLARSSVSGRITREITRYARRMEELYGHSQV